MTIGANRNSPLNKKGAVMVFGVFDLFHKGHRSFLAQARKHGKVVVVVARDKAIQKLKRKKPHHTEQARVAAVRKSIGVAKAILGDKIQGSYKIIKKIRPDIICLGYDQRGLEKDLKARMCANSIPAIPIFRLKAFKPRKFHTSMIRAKKKK